jgi:Putative MetA-pathway of phenol degradation
MIGSLARRCAPASFILTALALNFATSTASAHGDHGAAAGTLLPAGITLVSVDYDFVSFRQISDARLTALAANGVSQVHSLKAIAVPSLSLAYGVTKDFTLSARLPYLINQELRETDVAGPGVTARGGVRGLGDASFTGSYRVISEAQSGFDVALIAGLKAPTGRKNVHDTNGELFETEHQPGSGSWDILAGATIAKQVGKVNYSANALYAFAGDGSQDTRLGDRFSYGLNASAQLWTNGGHSHAPGTAPHMHLGAKFDGMMRHGGVDHAAPPPSSVITLDGSLGLNGQWSGKQRVAGERDDNTGGNIVYVTPGLKLTVDQWAGYVNVGIPVLRDVNGIQSDPRFQVTTGVAVKF